jgi:hypothetical protein
VQDEDGEGRAGHILCDAKPHRQPLNEGRFAHAEITVQGEDGVRWDHRGELRGELAGLSG